MSSFSDDGQIAVENLESQDLRTVSWYRKESSSDSCLSTYLDLCLIFRRFLFNLLMRFFFH
ncbi:unnamed protein product [Sphenostylis stenocarpa]|uniref:Uncharacterized protein n=1 Tax=Sphenostylis stenocarpa TaxID=92480 RepID=A0AA86VR33_9FABA|nr:unnamed protein product [Sphenostylis stenocarpa]